VVTCQETDVVGAVALNQVVVLLVRERLDRGGVEALASLAQREVHGELPHDGLARPCGGGDQDAVAVLDLPAGPDLEVVEPEGVEVHELRDGGVGPRGPELRVRLGGGSHANTFTASGTHSTVRGNAP